MNQELDIVMRQAVRKLWKPYCYSINSEEIYNQLLDGGLPVQDHEMSEIIQSWRKQLLVVGIGIPDAGAIRQHGAFTITWVSSRL